MPLHSDLLAHALGIATTDDSEAGNRWAASAAYYAVFHLLVAFLNWDRIKLTSNAKVFLTALAFQRLWGDRGSRRA